MTYLTAVLQQESVEPSGRVVGRAVTIVTDVDPAFHVLQAEHVHLLVADVMKLSNLALQMLVQTPAFLDFLQNIRKCMWEYLHVDSDT